MFSHEPLTDETRELLDKVKEPNEHQDLAALQRGLSWPLEFS